MGTTADTSMLPIWIVVGWATVFLVGTDLFVVSPFLPLIGKELGRPPQSLTALVSVFSLVYAAACPIQGRVAERFGPKAVLIFGVTTLAVANAWTAFASDFTNLLCSRALAGFAAASISPMIYTLTANSIEPTRRAFRLAIVNSGLIISLILGAPLGLLLGSMTEWRWVFLGLTFLLLATIPFNLTAWASPVAGPNRQAVTPRDERLIDSWPFLAGMIAWAASVYMTYTLLGTALATRLHLDVWMTSVFLSIFGIGAMIGVLTGGRLADRVGAPRFIRMSLAAMAVMFCLSATAFHLELVSLFALGIFLVALSAYGFFPAIQAIAASAFTTRRPTVLGLMSSSLYVGITLGSLAGGVVFDAYGITLVLVVSATVACAGLALVWSLPRR